jgi:hypothetical protein
MSRRKAFPAGERAFLIADEFAQEVYIGIATIGIEQADAEQAGVEQQSVKHARVKTIRAETLATALVSVLATLAFSLAAMIVGMVLARAWRWVGN